MELIETVELASSASSITFSSIPQDYDDLMILVSARSTRTGANQDLFLMNPNATTGSFSQVILFGDGSTATSSQGTTNAVGYLPTADTTSNTFGNIEVYISNYTSTGNKSISVDGATENNATNARQFIFACLSTLASAYTSIEMELNTSIFDTGSVFSLYGVTAGGDGTVTTS